MRDTADTLDDHDDYVRALEVIAEASNAVMQDLVVPRAEAITYRAGLIHDIIESGLREADQITLNAATQGV